MTSLSPICFTSDEVFIYAAIFGYNLTDTEATDADLIIARSNPYPESLNNAWTVINTSRNYPPEVIESWSEVYTYNCAWNPQTSGFGLLAQVSPGSSVKSASRFNMYIPEHGSSALSTSSEAIPSRQVLSGRNILLPVESDNTEAKSWLQVYMDYSVNQMSFSYLGKYLEFTGQPQVQWSMDTTKTGNVTNLGTIPVAGADDVFQFVPVPIINTTLPTAPWIYTFSPLNNGFSLNITNNSLSYDLSDTFPFYTDRGYYHDYFHVHTYQPESGTSKKSIVITFTVLSALCSMIVVAILMSRKKRKSLPEYSEEYELEASSGRVHVDDSSPSIYPSDTNEELPSYTAAMAPGSRTQRD
ncbi:hypothetical protein BGX21_003629 [Mortierella sp. AD011]|nr:hypothetical protein BGX21_003629 [Mortierella sp. AD011]